jgi:hypothetical protein
MDSKYARSLFDTYAGAVAFVAVESPDGTAGIGTAFHVGEGVFVTARHVVDGNTIVELATTHGSSTDLVGDAAIGARTFRHDSDGTEHPIYDCRPRALSVKDGPFFHKDPTVDVAVFRVESVDPYMPWIPLGGHLDDWVGANDFILSEAIVLGYPPISQTTEPILVAARAEVNASVDLRTAPHVHFILSATPRGGFSGGPAILEGEAVLGMVTDSLTENYKPSELGFFAVVSVEPIYVCLAAHKMLPLCQAEIWDGLWNFEDVDSFGEVQGKGENRAMRIVGSVGIFDDGRTVYIRIICDGNVELLQKLTALARGIEPSRYEEIRSGMFKLHIEAAIASARNVAAKLVDGSSELFKEAGYEALSKSGCHSSFTGDFFRGPATVDDGTLPF